MRPLAGREVWRIGDWGGASGQIGRHWEEVGDAALGALVGQPSPNQASFVPRAVVSFVYDGERQAAIQAAGLTNADALMLGPLDGRLALQPVDFKWSLEVARTTQIAAEALEALLAAEIPAVRQAIEERLEPATLGLELEPGAIPPADELVLLDGFFLAPEHAANYAFLDSQANRQKEAPLGIERVAFAPVDGQEFFSPLPGWEVGETLAAQEGGRRALARLEGAEHYYRLGAGVLGALTAMKRSIFDPAVPRIDALAELAALRRAQRLTTTAQLIGYLDRVMATRAGLVKTLNGLGRTIYPFAAFRQSLKGAGVVLPERNSQTLDDKRWNRVYGLVQRELSTQREAGRAMLGTGQPDAQILAALSGRSAELARGAGGVAQRLIAAELAASA